MTTLTVSGDESVDTNPRRCAPRGEDDDCAQRVESADTGRARHHVREQERKARYRGDTGKKAEGESDTDGDFSERDENGDPPGIGDDETVHDAGPPAVRGGTVCSETGDTGTVVVEKRRIFGAEYLGHTSLYPHDPDPDAHGQPCDRGNLGFAQPRQHSGRGAFCGIAENFNEIVHPKTFLRSVHSEPRYLRILSLDGRSDDFHIQLTSGGPGNS